MNTTERRSSLDHRPGALTAYRAGGTSAGFGRLLITIGVVGLIATAFGVFFGLRLVDRTSNTISGSLGLTSDAVATIEETITVAADSIAVAADGLDTLTRSVSGTEESFLSAGRLLDETAAAIATDVPDSIDAIRETMPALIRSAEVLDGALGALSIFGVDYAPDTPPADSLRRVETGLADVAERLRSGADQLGTVGESFTGLSEDAVTLTGTLEELSNNLGRADTLLEGYAATAARTAVLVDETVDDLDRQRTDGKLIVVLFGIVLALGQAVPITLGVRSLRSSTGSPIS